MAVLKHFSIKASPLATLKYIVGETKEHKAAIVTGLKCSEDPESAYMEMAIAVHIIKNAVNVDMVCIGVDCKIILILSVE